MPAMQSSHAVDRRQFLGLGAGLLGAACASRLPGSSGVQQPAPPLFVLSLAEWSFHRALAGKVMTNLDFPAKARELGIDGVEYVNSFFKDKARDEKYLTELQKRCADQGVQSVLIMCDGEGALGDADAAARKQAVENHHRWVEAAARLGCHSIRVNAQSSGSYEEQQKLAADGLRQLCEYGDKHNINVLVENHGGLSSNGKWLSGTLAMVKHPRIGALPDFGNFRVSATEEYDRYQGTDELMPFARGVSAKSHAFDERGEETRTDYHRMLEIVVVKHGYRGFVGIEYEGDKHSEQEGVVLTRDLLRKVRAELAAELTASQKETGR